MSSTTTTLRALAFAALAAAALGGCRSDGGIGRRDSMRGMRATIDSVSQQHERDVRNTARNIDALEDWFIRETTHPTEKMERTLSMYLEGHVER